MKKLVLCITLFFICLETTNAQITSGKYKILYAHNFLALQQSPDSYSPKLIIDSAYPSAIRHIQKNIDVWDVKEIAGRPSYYTIKNVATQKVITWATAGRTNAQAISFENALPATDNRRQAFKFELVKDFEYFIVPDDDGANAIATKLALGTQTATGPNSNIECVNTMGRNERIFTWGVVKKESVDLANSNKKPLPKSNINAVANDGDNKLYIDIKTGSDNLEHREAQEDPRIILKINSYPDIVVENINSAQTWPNGSQRRVTIALPSGIIAQNLTTLIIERKTTDWGSDEMIGADNWTIMNVKVTAYIKNQPIVVADYNRGTNSSRLFRFKYGVGAGGETGSLNAIYGYGSKVSFALNTHEQVTQQTNIQGFATVKGTFATGGDDLRGNGDNINITIRMKSSSTVYNLTNFNASRKWNNFQEYTYTKTLPNSREIDINDIKEVEIRHTGGGGMGADNWDMDKAFISIEKNGVVKVLVDKSDTPIHRFTGDTRSKKFYVE